MGNQHSRRRVRWTDLVLADDRFSHGETRAILATAAASNDGLRQVFMKNKTVAAKAGVSVRTAASARTKAKNAGLVKVLRQCWKTGKNVGLERAPRIAFASRSLTRTVRFVYRPTRTFTPKHPARTVCRFCTPGTCSD